MKKVLKEIVIAMMLAAVCVSFAGCNGKDNDSKKSSNEDKVVASKHFDAGNYDETMEVYFEDGKASRFVIIMEFAEETNATAIKESLENRSDMKDAKIEIDGSKVTIEMTAEQFFSEEGLDFDDEKASIDSIKQIFKENDFTIEE